MRIFFLLVDEPYYTAACLEPLLTRWRSSIAGAAFPSGFFDWRRLASSVQLYGVRGTASRIVRVAFASLGGGDVHRQFAARGIPAVDAADVNAPEFLETLKTMQVDLIVSLNCPQKLKQPLLALPAHGCINVHFGKLPRYRGILPIFYALMNRDPSFGVTVHLMDEKLDNGAIIVQRDVPILPQDTLETLYPRAFAVASELLDQALGAFEHGQVVLQPNPESEKTYYSYPSRHLMREYRKSVRH